MNPSEPQAPDSRGHGPGRRLLGPYVVGQRVVVRRLLRGETGPSGGPAMTDVLGVCTEWDDDACVVQPEAGPPVRIAFADIVSGKPVPPRPSARHRVSVLDAERHTTSLVAGLEAQPLGDWLLRFDPHPVGRVRSRFNSCLAMGDPGTPVAQALGRVEGFYIDRGRSAQVQVERGSHQEAAIGELGWAPVAGKDAHFLLASLVQVRRRLGAGADDVALTEDGPRVTARIRDRAAGLAAIDGDWLGVHGLEVEPEHRRNGHALEVMTALLEWGAEQGATTVWLHVETDNEPALALYEPLGFAVHHTCRYLARSR